MKKATLKETRKKHSQVLAVMEPGKEYTPAELARASGLTLRQVQTALNGMRVNGHARRRDTFGKRSVWRRLV